MSGLLQDVKFGFRIIAHNPWFTFVAALTLALGIGVNTVGFSIANGVWWKRLPFQNPKEVVTLGMSDGSIDPDLAHMSYPEFDEIRSRARSFKSLAAMQRKPIVLANEGNITERYAGAHITSNLFTLLGVPPVRGRDFTAEDGKRGAPQVVLISYDIWQSRYGGRDDAVGRAVRVDAAPGTIVGIMPPGFKFPFIQRVWVPLIATGKEKRSDRSLDVFARLAGGIDIREAQSEASAIAQSVSRNHADTNKGYDAVVLTFMNWVQGPNENVPLFMIFGAVGFILLIACANTANLFLSRAVRHTREIAVRTALGASRWRIIRQVLVEAVMLSLLGGVFGLFFAKAGVRWLDYAISTARDSVGMPFWMNFEMDYRVLAYVALICVATGIGFGFVPAIHISRTNVNDNLKVSGRQTSGGLRARRTQTILLVAELAMTIVLLAEAGLLMRGFLRLTQMKPGVDTGHLLLAQLQLPGSKYPDDSHRVAFVETLMQHLKSPDYSATIAWAAPLGGTIMQQLKLEDRDIEDKTGKLTDIGVLPVDPGYFSTLDVKFLRGRDFQAWDGRKGAEVAIVNERFAAKYWPAEDPIGKRLRLGDKKAPWLSVIGVTPDVFQDGNPVSGPRPVVYVPYRQFPVTDLTIIVRNTDMNATVTQLRSELATIDPDLALYNLMTFDESLRVSLWEQRTFGVLVGILAVMALVLSSTGLYGVTAHGVNQRTQEIGIRTALGATPFRIIRLVLRESSVRIVLGLTLGLTAAVFLTDLTSRVLYAVEPNDLLTFVLTSTLLVLVALAASIIPARRAARLNSVDALRID
jgi:predicted permease